MKICIIDDNPSMTSLFSKALKLKGHECVTKNDGRSGLKLLENEKFDAVVCDFAMSEFTGLDVLKALNDSGKIKEHKIVILTGSPESTVHFEELKSLGAKEVLKKPIRTAELLTTLERISVPEIKKTDLELRELEQASSLLEEINEYLEKNETISKEIFDNFSHELRTPTVTIKAYTDMLLQGKFGELTTEQKERLQRINDNTDLLIKVIFMMLEKIQKRTE